MRLMPFIHHARQNAPAVSATDHNTHAKVHHTDLGPTIATACSVVSP